MLPEITGMLVCFMQGVAHAVATDSRNQIALGDDDIARLDVDIQSGIAPVSAASCSHSCYPSESDEAPLLQLYGNRFGKRSRFNAQAVPVSIDSSIFPGSRGKAKTVLCFSGGGSRSLSASLGALRALSEMGILPNNIDAIGSVSGGTWAAVQYMFAVKRKGRVLSADDLLGRPTEVGRLSMSYLGSAKSTIGESVTASWNAVAMELFAKILVTCSLKLTTSAKDACWKQKGAEAWLETIGTIILEPYGLDCNSCYMAPTHESASAIQHANPALQKAKWTVPRADRPKTFLMSGTLLSPLGYKSSQSSAVSFQMSPDFVGSPFHPNRSTVQYQSAFLNLSPDLNSIVGGGLIEAFAFGGRSPSNGQNGGPGLIKVPAPAIPFTLTQAVGMSSASFASKAAEIYPTQILTPKALYWPVTSSAKQTQTSQWYNIGDGGNIENLGMLAMLQSGATKFAVFINTVTPLADTSELDMCNIPAGTDLSQSVSNTASSNLGCLFGYSTDTGTGNYFCNNQVFSRTDYPPLLCNLQRLRDRGKPAVVSQTLEVLENTWWGIPGGANIKAIWVYQERVSEFVSQLPEDTQASLAQGDTGPFAHYPFYSTMFENPLDMTQLSLSQVNLLAAQFEYSVKQNSELFCNLFNCSSRG